MDNDNLNAHNLERRVKFLSIMFLTMFVVQIITVAFVVYTQLYKPRRINVGGGSPDVDMEFIQVLAFRAKKDIKILNEKFDELLDISKSKDFPVPLVEVKSELEKIRERLDNLNTLFYQDPKKIIELIQTANFEKNFKDEILQIKSSNATGFKNVEREIDRTWNFIYGIVVTLLVLILSISVGLLISFHPEILTH